MDFDDDEQGQEPSAAARWATRAVIATVVLALLGGLAWWLRGFLAGAESKAPAVHQIALIKQPPPPPPKPPDKPPPEPPKAKEQVKLDEPKEVPKPAEQKAPDEKPASDKPVALDAPGGAGTDAFGLPSRPGGTDVTEIGNGRTTNSRGAYYSGLLQRAFFDALSRNRKVLKDEFRVVVKVWLSDDGRVQRADVVTGSGNPETDELIQLTLLDMAPMKDVPPSSMRPMQLRLSNRS